MDSSMRDIFIVSILVEEIENNKRKKIKRKRQWVDPLWRERNLVGEYATLVSQLKEDDIKFKQHFRMDIAKFHKIADLLRPVLQKQNTKFRLCISVEERLCVTLSVNKFVIKNCDWLIKTLANDHKAKLEAKIIYLCSGNSFKSIGFQYRMGYTTVRIIVLETCAALCNILMPIVLPQPSTEVWRKIEERFSNVWNYPNCIGAVDGKHVSCVAPPNSGSLYFNYKKNFSVVLFAVVDADYNFVIVDVGSYGKNSDGGILSHSNFGKRLFNNKLNIPADKSLPGTTALPHVFIGDEAFPLHRHLMRPYPGEQARNNNDIKVYNYRHSRARRIVESAFGILAQRFEIYQKKIRLSPDHLNKVIMATICLHNFISTTRNSPTVQDEVTEHSSTLLRPLTLVTDDETTDAFNVREKFKMYFNSEYGNVNWQDDIVHRT